ncbi:DUF559 domain-containing protein [Nocardioides sp. WS12]|uniref:DUF559 domain-containing protein n=1 Tax=Nocardioides sp. WS12 TaxID=2486272 RepID=UPI0015F93439|nr:DUF559 domain-containing protein [Nocardioides sp. WS12]
MLDPTRPFTRAAALAAGLTDRQLGSPRHVRLHASIYVDATVALTPALRAEAALLSYAQGSWASHATAARMWRLPIPALPEEHVTVVRRQDRRNRVGIVCHCAPDATSDLVRLVEGVPVSSPEQVFVELATQLPLVELVVVGDHMVRRGMVRLDRLRAHCALARGSGSAQARTAAAYVRERVDSPMESRLRMLIVLAGLPEPLVNITYGDDEGLAFRRYDLSWPEVRLIVEYDGRHHVERIEQWESDLARREEIDDDGWRILVVIAKGVYARPDVTVAKIHRLLVRRGHPRVPTQPDQAWQRHFPGSGSLGA